MARKSGKNEGYSYRKTKNGKIECRAYFDMPNNERKQLSARGKTEKDARNNLLKKYSERCKADNVLKNKDYTVSKWFNHWLFKIMKPIFDANKTDTTSWYERLSRKFIPIIGKIKLKKLKISNIQEVINSMLQDNLSGKYIKEVVCLLSTCLNYAVTEGYMVELDFSKLKKPKVKKNKKIIYGNTEKQVLIDYFTSDEFDIKYLPIKAMFDTGLRPEEIGGLNIGDIDLDLSIPCLHIERAFIIRDTFDENGNKTGREKVLKDTKTEDGKRDIPIPTLVDNFKEQEKNLIMKRYSVSLDDPLFRNSRGGRYTQETLRDLFNKLAEELNITQLGCYSLRHGFVFDIIGVTDIETTRTLVGHDSIKTTQNYLQSSDNRKEKAMYDFAQSRYGNSKEKSA